MTYKHEDKAVQATREWAAYRRACAECTPTPALAAFLIIATNPRVAS
jgi:hypothetical protein